MPPVGWIVNAGGRKIAWVVDVSDVLISGRQGLSNEHSGENTAVFLRIFIEKAIINKGIGYLGIRYLFEKPSRSVNS